MKLLHYGIVSIFVLFLTLIACKKKDDVNVSADDTFTVKVNGKNFVYANWLSFRASYERNGGFSANNDSVVSLYLTSYDQGKYPVEQFNISNVNVHQTNIKLYSYLRYIRKTHFEAGKDDTAFATFYLGYADVLSDGYTMLESDSAHNQLILDEYDAQKKRVKGHFSLTMYRFEDTTKPADLGYPDTLRFTEGKFDLAIKN